MIVVVMGVSGSGKSTIGSALAAALGADFAEGDRYHPAANIAKMTRGEPLGDEDRLPWLQAMAADIARWRAEGRSVVLACSALRQAYRDILGIDGLAVRLVYLRGSAATIAPRMGGRSGHFMPPALLGSQFDALEEPHDAIVADIAASPALLVQQILMQLRTAGHHRDRSGQT